MSADEPDRGRFKRLFRLDAGRHHSAAEAETDAELRFHFAQRVDALLAAGRTPAEAEAEALERFGPFDESRAQLVEAARLREETLNMADRLAAFRQDLAYVARQLRRAPGFTIAVLLTFALGIGANATMFGVIDRMLLRPPAFVRDPGRIVAFVAGRDGHFGQRTANYPVYRALRDKAPAFENVAATATVSVPMGRGLSAQNVSGLLATATYFPMLGVSPAFGRFFRADEDQEPMGTPVAVLSYGFWQRQFAGAASAVGTTVFLGDRQFTVIGVAPKGFTGIDLVGPDVWIPMSAAGSLQPMGASWARTSVATWLRVFARVRRDVPIERAADDAMRVAREAAPDAFFTHTGWSFHLVPIMRARASEQGTSASVMTLLGVMSVIVLLIACVNVANLLVARGLRRRREIAVRLALGVARSRLVAQLLTETLLLAIAGGAAALLIAYWGGGAVRRLLFADTPVDAPPVDMRVLAFTMAVALVVGAVTGLMPALAASTPDVAEALKQGTREGGGRRSRTRNILLGTQAALCFVLLAGAGLFVRSLARLGAMPLGVDVDRVFVGTMNLRGAGRPKTEIDAIFARALERVRAIPGIAAAAVGVTVPFGPSYGTGVAMATPDSTMHGSAMFNAVTDDYFRALGSRMLIGREFTPSDAEGAPRVAVVNEMLATRVWGKASPIGRCIHIGADTVPCAEIVGVVENVRRQSIFEDSTNSVYVPLAQARTALPERELVMRASGEGDARRFTEPLRMAIQTAAPQLPYADVQLVADSPTVREELRPTRLGATLFGAFGALALALAAIGVYGVVSYDVGQRTREVGVRLALGAREADVARLVVWEGVRVVALGTLVGAGTALIGGRFVASLLFEVSPRDPVVFGGIAASLLVVAAVACIVPAVRAMRVDAVVALRAE
jgi:predicted permease